MSASLAVGDYGGRRRRRRRRRSYGDLVSMPTFGDITEYNPLGHSVNSTDVMLGVGVGLLGGQVVKYAIKQIGTKVAIPGPVLDYIAPLSAFLAGVAAYMLQRKTHRGRGTGHLVGATIAGAMPVAWGLVKQNLAPMLPAGFLDGYVTVGYDGLIVDNPTQQGMSGMIVDNPTQIASYGRFAGFGYPLETDTDTVIAPA